MGVKSCSRIGCDNIMCDDMIFGNYICRECISEMRTLRIIPQVFMNTQKTEYTQTHIPQDRWDEYIDSYLDMG